MEKKVIWLFTSFDIQKLCLEENKIPFLDYFPTHIDINCITETGKSDKITVSNGGTRGNKFDWVGADWIEISEDNCKKYFVEAYTKEPTDFFVKLNLEQYTKLIEWKNKLVLDFKNVNDIDKDIAHTIETKVSQLNHFKIKFLEWFIDREVLPPNLEELELPNNLEEIKTQSESISKSTQKLKSKDAYLLLKNLESNNYLLTDDDEKILNHHHFNTYKSKHIKKLLGEKFNSVIAELEKQAKMTYEKFYSITFPPSDWYKMKFVESFSYHCTNPLGKYFDRCKGKELVKNASVNDNGKRKSAFILK